MVRNPSNRLWKRIGENRRAIYFVLSPFLVGVVAGCSSSTSLQVVGDPGELFTARMSTNRMSELQLTTTTVEGMPARFFTTDQSGIECHVSKSRPEADLAELVAPVLG